MKKQIYFLLFAIIALVWYSLFYNAKSHVESVEAVEELVVMKESLFTKVDALYREKDSAITQLYALDSTLTVKDSLILKQRAVLYDLKQEKMAVKVMPPIIIHDTIYITETKNFWGRKKTSIEATSNGDTLLEEPSFEELELDTVQ